MFNSAVLASGCLLAAQFLAATKMLGRFLEVNHRIKDGPAPRRAGAFASISLQCSAVDRAGVNVMQTARQ
jgi:hypothetical protein